jgi:hypothetical protein
MMSEARACASVGVVQLRREGECSAAVGDDRRWVGVGFGLVAVDAVNNGDVVEDRL